jgi:acyl dehydratase
VSTTTVHVDVPQTWQAYLRALAARKPASLPPGGEVPVLEARDVRRASDPRRLGAYRELCGFPPDGALPLTWPHVLAAPLQLAVLSSPAFPVRLLGLVHLRNVIRRRVSIPEDARLDLRCGVAAHRATPRGDEIDLVTEASLDGAVVWEETTTILARAAEKRDVRPAGPRATPALFSPGAAESTWRLGADLGRRYAAVSGDWNPIHLTAATARLFGFRSAIVHGMWSLARTAAQLEADGGPIVELTCAFKLPVLLPATVTLHRWSAEGAVEFALTDAGGTRPHAMGRAVR